MTGKDANAKAKVGRKLEMLRNRQRRSRAGPPPQDRKRITVWALREDVEGLKLAAGEGRAFSRLHEAAKAELTEELRGQLTAALDAWVGGGPQSASSKRIRAAFDAAVEAKETLDLRLKDLMQALGDALDETVPVSGEEGVSLGDLLRAVAVPAGEAEEGP